MSVLKLLSALIRALALYCRDSGQVPLSMCRFRDLMAASAWKILLSDGFSCCLGWLWRRFLGFSFGLVVWLSLLLWRAGRFCLLLLFSSFGTWKDVVLSLFDVSRRSSSGMSEVSMLSSSLMASEVPGTASSPSDVNRFLTWLKVRQWSGKTAVSTLSCGSLLLPIILKWGPIEIDSRYRSGQMGVFQPIYTRGEDRKCCIVIGPLVLTNCVDAALIPVSSAWRCVFRSG